MLFISYRKLSFNAEKSFIYTYILVPCCLIGSTVFHPGFFDEGFDFGSMMIAFGNYLEAGALIPQLKIMKKEGYVKKELSLYILLLTASRGLMSYILDSFICI